MYINIKSTNSSVKKIFVVLLISLFVFSQELRSILGPKNYTVNILGTISIFVLLIKNLKAINKKKLAFLYITMIMYIFSSAFYENNLMKIFTGSIIVVFPLILTIIEVNKDILRDIFKQTIIILNLIVISITIIGVLEIVFNLNINSNFSPFFSSRLQEQIFSNSVSENKRLYSFMGHPLFNTELYLLFFVLNILFSKYFKEKPCPIWVLITAVIGVAFTASKSGFVLLSFIIIFLFKYNNRIKKVTIAISSIIIAFYSGLFDNLISRFFSGSLTSGRNEMWFKIRESNIFPIKFFTGYGRGFTFQINSYMEWASAAFEYPLRMFSLELGVIMTIMIYIFIMVIPIITLVKRKQYYLLYSYLVIFIDVNTFNGLSTSGDKMIIFCLFIFLVLNLSNYIREIDGNNEKNLE